MSSFFRHTGITLLSTVAQRLINIAIGVMVARYLGPAGKGEYALITSFCWLLFLFGSFGLATSNVYFTGRGFSLNRLISNSVAFGSVFGGGCLLLYWLLGPKIHSLFLRDVGPDLVLIGALGMPFLFLKQFLQSILLGKNLIGQWNALNVGSTIALFLLLILLLILGLGLRGAVIAFVLSLILTTEALLILLHRVEPIRFIPDLKILKDSLVFGLKGHMGNLVNFLNYRLDMFIIDAFIGKQEVGYYVVATSLVGLITVIPSAVRTVLYPRVASSGQEGVNVFTSIVSRNTLLICGFASVLLLLFAYPVICGLYGKEFLSALIPLLILLPGVTLMGFSNVFSSYLTGKGKPILCSYSTFLALPVTIGLDLLLIPRWGIKGAALASTMAYSIIALTLLCFFVKISGVPIRAAVIPRKSDLGSYGEALRRQLQDLRKLLAL